MTHTAILVALAAAVIGAGCVRSGAGGRRGNPIDARSEPLQLVACQSLIGEEHNQSDVTATTMLGLNPHKLASRPGQETGVRGHPTDTDVVVLARQLRTGDPNSTEIYVSSLRGQFADERLTRDGFADLEPCWSPDGLRVLFASDRGGTFQVWRIDRDGNNLAPVTEPAVGVADRAPDAQSGRIVFARTTTTAAGPVSAIWIMQQDGGGMTPLTTGVPGTASPGFAPGDHEPALARDGASVVFSRRVTVARATLMRLELATQRLSELAINRDGEDRLPRFLPGGRLLAARTAPAEGILGRRLVSFAPDGSDLVHLTLDARLACHGADALAGAAPLPVPATSPTPSDLDADDARIVVGRRTLGAFDLVRTKDGAGLQLATVALTGKEVAGVFLPFKLALPEPTDIARVRLRATFALTLAPQGARLRISVQDYVRNRFDVAWDHAVASTQFTDAEVVFASLAHVDRNGWIRVEIAAELPDGQRAEMALDSVTVEAFAHAP